MSRRKLYSTRTRSWIERRVCGRRQGAFRTGEVQIPAMIWDLLERVPPDASLSEGGTSNGGTPRIGGSPTTIGNREIAQGTFWEVRRPCGVAQAFQPSAPQVSKPAGPKGRLGALGRGAALSKRMFALPGAQGLHVGGGAVAEPTVQLGLVLQLLPSLPGHQDEARGQVG